MAKQDLMEREQVTTMNDGTNWHLAGRFDPSRSNDEARLQAALCDSDRLLTDSLRKDERRRRRRRLIIFTVLTGGVAMGTIAVAVMAGWLSLAAVAGVEGVSEKALAKSVPGTIVRTLPVTKDSMVLAYMPQWNFGDIDNIGVANNDGGVRTFFAWETLPKDALGSKNRRVYLAVYSRKTTAAKEGGKIQIAPLATEWNQSPSWESQPKGNETAKAVVTPFQPGEGWKLFDVTPLIEQQANVGKAGVVMRFEEENQSASGGDWSGYEFVSREAEKEWKDGKPRLLVVDVDPAKEKQQATQSEKQTDSR
jgi:hypothetical protein